MGWATVVSCDVACHVMSLDVLVMSFDAMWLLVLCHVTWCNAMSCDVRSCEELSSVVPCNGMECYEVKPPLFSNQLLCNTKYYSSTTPTLLCTSKYHSSTTPTLLCTSKYYSTTALCCRVLLQYYSVLQSTTPALLCTTKYYSSTTKYYSSTTTYYSVLQSTTPVLLCTTKYYSSTTPYYKVLLQYYSVLQSATPVLQSTTPVLLRTTKYYSSTTLYYKVLFRYYFETSFTMRVAKRVTLQLHQILHLPRKMNLMIDPPHIWKVIYNARSSKSHPPTSPDTAPATQKNCHQWSASHMKRHFQCAEQQESPCNFTKYCACHAKWMSWFIHLSYETSVTMRGATDSSSQPHQILRLPRKRNVMIDPSLVWNIIYNARSNRHHLATSPNTAPAKQKECHDWSFSPMERHLQCSKQQASPCNLTKYCACHAKGMTVLFLLTYETSFTISGATGISPPTSPNTAPATPKECHDWSASHMKRHLQCAEQQASTSNLTKYCACHAKLHSQILEKFTENRWSGISNARPIRAWSEHDPTMIRAWSDPENANRNPPRHRGYFSHSPGADSIENYNVSRSGYHSKFHHMLRLPRKVTHELHQMLHLPQKVTHELHQMLHLPRKVTHDLHEMVHLPRKVTRELHQMLHLPRQRSVMIDLQNVIYNVRSNRHQPPTSPNTAPATQNCTPKS